MTYKKIRLFTGNRVPEALSNLWYRNECSAMEITDAVEDAKDAGDLLMRLQGMELMRRIEGDRETDTYIRFKTIDCWGNISYLQIWK